MKLLWILILVWSSAAVAAGAVNFDAMPSGKPPEGWRCGVTGRGSPQWLVSVEPTAPSKPNVLQQSGQGSFPWCVKDAVSVVDGHVEVKFMPTAGKEDQAGGVVWRFKNADDYYVARANALENNVSLYYMQRGSRQTLKYVNAPVAANQWHLLRVDFKDRSIQVSLDGTSYIALEDGHIAGSGSVGVWTKADSVTVFDDFLYGETPAR